MPSDDDKVVAQLVEKFFSNGTNQHDPSTIAQRLESAIREAIQETRKQQWIPVSKKLPGPGTTVMAIARGSTEVHFLKLFYDGEGAGECGCPPEREIHGDYWWHESHNGALAEYLYLDSDDGRHTVTHWMPLPEPPVDSKDAAEGTEAR